MQVTDKYLGVVLCFFFAACSFPARLFRSRSRPGQPARILIIKFWGFGSIVLASSCFRALRRQHPEAYICALTLEQNREVFELCGVCDEIVTVDVGSVKGFLFSMARALGRIRSRRYDIAFDLEFTARYSALWAFFSRARSKIGFAYPGIWRGTFFSRELRFDEKLPLTVSLARLFALAGVEVRDGDREQLRAGEAHERAVSELLEREGISGRVLVRMNINASDLSTLRRWPREYFLGLARELADEYGCHVVFIGSEGDKDYVASALASAGHDDRLHDLSGKMSIPELSAFFRRLRLFVTNDSGPLHLAAACGVPTVSFFGPETPAIYGPQGESHAVFYRGLSCSPCIRVQNYKHYVCRRDRMCLRSIYPQEVLEKIRRMGLLRPARDGREAREARREP